MPLKDTHIDPITNKVKEKVGEAAFNSWFKGALFFVEDESTLGISVGSGFLQKRIESDYLHLIREAAELVTHQTIKMHLTTSRPVKEKLLKRMPERDRQFNLFVPVISEIPIKDDVHLMEIAPFTLQPRSEKRTRILYNNIDGMDIEITAHQEYGLITHVDYDIVLMMQSNLAQAANIYRSQLADYEKLSLIHI